MDPTGSLAAADAAPLAASTPSSPLSLPSHILGFFSYSFTLTLSYRLIVFVVTATALLLYLIVRYVVLNKYTRLPPAHSATKSVAPPFDLQPPDHAEDDKDGHSQGYAEDFMSAFLSSIKIFGYLDRPVFHELARHLQSRKLKAGEILFGADDDKTDFYVVVEGSVQVFVKAQNSEEEDPALEPIDDEDAEFGVPGHHLLNEVGPGGSVTSLFSILSIFTADLTLPKETVLRSRSAEQSPHEGTFPDAWLRLKRIESGNAINDPTPTLGDYRPDETDPSLESAPDSGRQSVLTDIVARAAIDTTLIVIPAEAFRKLTEKFPNSAAHIVQVILTRFQRVTFLTLYRYLGLTKELLKIEKTVNEFAGYGLPDGFFRPGTLERLHSYSANTYRASFETVSFTDIEAVGNHSVLRKPHRPPGLASRTSHSRLKVVRKPQAEDSDAEPPRIKTSAIPGLLPSVKTPAFTSVSAMIPPEDEEFIKQSVMDCMAQILGVGNTPVDMLLRRPALSTKSSEAPTPIKIVMDDSEASSAQSSTSSLPHAAPLSHASSLSMTTADTATDMIQIMYFERGATLIKEGERNDGLYFVIDGMLQASMKTQVEVSMQPKARQTTYDAEVTEPRGVQTRSFRKSLFLIKPGGLAGYLAALTGHASFVTIRAKKDTLVGFMSRANLDRLVERHPAILLTLAKRLISQLSPIVLHIDVALEWTTISAGQLLCRQGDHSDALYIVLNGRLRSIAEHQRNGEKQLEILGEYGQGESVGEQEVLTDVRRPATIHAIRDTEIAVMPKTLFNTLCLRHPEITIQMAKIIATRSISTPQRLPASSIISDSLGAAADLGKNNVNLKTVALLPVNGITPIAEFADKLGDALELIGASVARLNTSAVMSKLGKHAFNRLGRLKLNNWLAEQEESYRIVLYIADGGVNAPWTQRCIRQADCILLVGLGDGDPSIGEFERLLLGMKTTARKELVLLHSERRCQSGSTARWLKNRLWIHAHHHVHMPIIGPKIFNDSRRQGTLLHLRHLRGQLSKYYAQVTAKDFKADHSAMTSPNIYTGIRSDFARLSRRLLSRSIGLVLGGGGARGLSHLGVIRAFEEAGIPIDMVGGTSIGSFVSGLYARENDHVSIYGRAKSFSGRMTSVWRQLMDLTYPVTSLFNGHEFNRGIWKCFSNTQIEDCWLSFFAVTTNITWSRMEIHQKGYMWRYIRASMSLSGYLPPLCDNGNMLLDGGYLNNLPADVMRSLGAETIVAVDVGNVDDTSPVNYGDTLSGWWVLLRRYNPFEKTDYGKIPQLADIQSRLAYVSSVKQLEEAKRVEGCYYLHPPVHKYGVLSFDKFQEIYETGYRFGQDIVQKWEKDGTLQKRFGVRKDDGKPGKTGHARRASI
ncbi:uncharacterized protein BJ171DRAFT_434169 [Polychytrium aggregatum]|uniref:uncharacterized protein n=1 Tax=Polychytrium aggregatum TaxID=110093 RepID=UPI0022FE7ACF|nr:uncharacterized protein BJ171DRAFT_434169 [Polychytrium aggregatum]KAI9190694.1 hypothetical protein BJ171DRAFT_434169 [Polychytrium aggregatum]